MIKQNKNKLNKNKGLILLKKNFFQFFKNNLIVRKNTLKRILSLLHKKHKLNLQLFIHPLKHDNIRLTTGIRKSYNIEFIIFIEFLTFRLIII